MMTGMEPLAYRVPLGERATHLATINNRVIIATTPEEAERMAAAFPHWTPVPFATISVSAWEAAAHAR